MPTTEKQFEENTLLALRKVGVIQTEDNTYQFDLYDRDRGFYLRL